MKHVASKCDKFGIDVTFTKLESGAAPIMKIGMDSDVNPPDENPTGQDCSTCANWIDPQQTLRTFGFVGSVCRAKGNLQISSWESLVNYSKGCTSYTRFSNGTHVKNRTNSFTLFPQYGANFLVVDIARSYREAMAQLIDPRVYQDDKGGPVTQGMLNRNIRAWRRVTDPDGVGQDVFLPIFDSAKWKEENYPYYHLIPQLGDDEEPETYADHGGHLYTQAVMWMELDETTAAWGDGGVGKTEFFRWLAWMMQLPYKRISITGESDLDEIMGKMVFRNGQTEFIYGTLPDAWDKPGIINLDEPNTGPNEVWQVIRPLTDNSKVLVVARNENERKRRGIDTYLGLAMNPNWNILNVGTNTVGDADLSRLMHMYFGYPPEDLLMEILRHRVAKRKRVIHDSQLRAMMRVTADLRQMAAEGKIDTSWGVRHDIKVANALSFFPAQKAYKLAIADALEPKQMELITGAVSSHFKA
jgi:MoxR-like ATPase